MFQIIQPIGWVEDRRNQQQYCAAWIESEIDQYVISSAGEWFPLHQGYTWCHGDVLVLKVLPHEILDPRDNDCAGLVSKILILLFEGSLFWCCLLASRLCLRLRLAGIYAYPRNRIWVWGSGLASKTDVQASLILTGIISQNLRSSSATKTNNLLPFVNSGQECVGRSIWRQP